MQSIDSIFWVIKFIYFNSAGEKFNRWSIVIVITSSTLVLKTKLKLEIERLHANVLR